MYRDILRIAKMGRLLALFYAKLPVNTEEQKWPKTPDKHSIMSCTTKHAVSFAGTSSCLAAPS